MHRAEGAVNFLEKINKINFTERRILINRI